MEEGWDWPSPNPSPKRMGGQIWADDPTIIPDVHKKTTAIMDCGLVYSGVFIQVCCLRSDRP